MLCSAVMTRLRSVLAPVVLLLLTDSLILSGAPLVVRALGVFLLVVVLPGWNVAQLLIGRAYNAEQRLETFLYGVAAGYGIVMVLLLVLSYLPGQITASQLLLFFHLLALITLGALLLRAEPIDKPVIAESALPRSFWFWLAGIVGAGAILRLTWLGYSEFQGDEARVLLRAQELLADFSNAIYIHDKTPGEILLSAAGYGILGETNEAAARLPFALANLAALAGMLLLGWRMFGSVAGVVAAVFLAVDGYAVAFGRIVQYQNIVILSSVLIVLLLYRTPQQIRTQHLTLRLLLATIMILGGVYAHFEGLAIALPAVWLMWLIARRVGWGVFLRALVPTVLVGIGALALFFVPWVRYPGFATTYGYVVNQRLGTQLHYNNVVDILQRTMLYSSSYYVIALISVTVAGAAAIYVRQWGRAWGVFLGLLLAGALVLAAYPGAISMGGIGMSGLPLSLLLGVICVLPVLGSAERIVWIWFAPLCIASLFLVARPDSHVYVFFLPWMLVLGASCNHAWLWVAERSGRNERRWRFAWAGIGALLFVLFFGWPWLIFADAPAERLRNWETEQPAGYWYPFAQPPERAIMGFPLRNGWKSIGVLYAADVLQGRYDTNARPEVAEWYTRGAGACPDEAAYFLLTQTVEPTDDALLAELRAGIAGWAAPAGTVTVGGVDRLALFAYDANASQQRVADEDATVAFAALTAQEPQSWRGRVLALPAHTPVDATLGDATVGDSTVRGAVQLRGYVIDAAEYQPGMSVSLRLFWESKLPLGKSYTVFLQLVDPATNTKAGQQDALPVCGQYLTSNWRPGDLIEDPHTIAILPDAAPGVYHLYAGMYDVKTGERLPIRLVDGSAAGDWVDLFQIEIE